MALTKPQIREFVKLTSDAYSFKRYGVRNWSKAIEYLESENLSLVQMDYILRHKIMRISADSFCESNEKHDEILNGLEVKSYFSLYPTELIEIRNKKMDEDDVKKYESIEQKWHLDNHLPQKEIKKKGMKI